MASSPPQVKSLSKPPRRISRRVLEHPLMDPVSREVWNHWLTTGEAVVEDS